MGFLQETYLVWQIDFTVCGKLSLESSWKREGILGMRLDEPSVLISVESVGAFIYLCSSKSVNDFSLKCTELLSQYFIYVFYCLLWLKYVLFIVVRCTVLLVLMWLCIDSSSVFSHSLHISVFSWKFVTVKEDEWSARAGCQFGSEFEFLMWPWWRWMCVKLITLLSVCILLWFF